MAQSKQSLLSPETEVEVPRCSCSSAEEEIAEDLDFVASCTKRRIPQKFISLKTAATLDRTNTSIRKPAMLMTTVVNEMEADKSLIPSRNAIHHQYQKYRQEATELIRREYTPSKSVVH